MAGKIKCGRCEAWFSKEDQGHWCLKTRTFELADPIEWEDIVLKGDDERGAEN